jgi:acyl-CoA synthetase (AMP-forming)/AMP-acid ligase II
MDTDWRSGTISQLVEECGRCFSSRPYIIPEESIAPITYEALLDFCVGIECRFDDLGVPPGASVVVNFPNSTLMALLFVAIPFSGRVYVPIHPSYREAEVRHIVQSVDGVLLMHGGDRIAGGCCAFEITVEDHATFIHEIMRKGAGRSAQAKSLVRPQTPAEIVFTSGSSGRPKGVLLSHSNLLANSYTIIEHYGVTGDDRMLTTIPLTHVGGQAFTTLGPLWVGAATTIVLPEFGLINFWSVVESLDVTWSVVMAAFLSGLLRRRGGVNVGRLKGLLSGGSAVSAKLINDFHDRFGVQVYQVYGQTEMSSIVVSEPPEDPARVVGSVGKPLLGVRARVVTDGGDDAAAGERGEIWLSGPTRFLGYVKREEETRNKMVGDYVKTGDCGYFDAHSNLHVVGRLDDMIIIGGENIYPAEVESRASEIPWIEDVVVSSVPHEILGEELVLTYKPKAEYEPDIRTLVSFLRETLSAAKVPRNNVSLEAFGLSDWPRTASGKIDRVEMARLTRAKFGSA